MEDFRKAHGNTALWERLSQIDPVYAQEIHPNSYPYICRAIEVKIRTGKSKKDFRGERKSLYPAQWHWTYDGDREKLYTRINSRVQNMFDVGWEKEVLGLLEQGYSQESPGMKTIGYAEISDFLRESSSASKLDLIKKVQQHNRNYAKRQITWFNRKCQDTSFVEVTSSSI